MNYSLVIVNELVIGWLMNFSLSILIVIDGINFFAANHKCLVFTIYVLLFV